MDIKRPEGFEVVKMEYDEVIGYSNFDQSSETYNYFKKFYHTFNSNKKMSGFRFRKHRYRMPLESDKRNKPVALLQDTK